MRHLCRWTEKMRAPCPQLLVGLLTVRGEESPSRMLTYQIEQAFGFFLPILWSRSIQYDLDARRPWRGDHHPAKFRIDLNIKPLLETQLVHIEVKCFVLISD